MSEIIAIANQKGGVGKTTTAINFSAALSYLGQETLLVDLDSQGNATSGLGIERAEIEFGVYHSLLDQIPVEKTIRPTEVDMLDIIGSTPELISAEIELAREISRESRLKSVLDQVHGMYNFIVIDCPPSLGLLTINALCAADKVIVPVQGEYYALEGLARFVDTVEKVRSRINSKIQIEGGVLTMFDSRFSLAQQVRSEIAKFFREKLFKTCISRSVRLAECPSFGKTIFQYDPHSKGSENYLSLTGEFLIRRGWRGMRIN